MDSFIIWIVMFLVVIGLAAYAVIRLLMHLLHGGISLRNRDSSVQIAFSKEDAVGQLLIVVGIAFAGLTLYNIDRNLGSPVSWTWVFLLTSLTATFLGFWKKLLYPVVAGSVTFFIWAGSQATEWSFKYSIQPVVVVSILGLILLSYYLIGAIYNMLPKWKRFGTVFTALGFVGVVFILLGLSTSSGLAGFADLIKGSPFYASQRILILLLIIVAGFITSLVIAFKKKASSFLEAPVLGFLALFFICLLFAPQSKLYQNSVDGFYNYGYASQLSSVGVGWTLLFNILTFLVMVGVVYSGYVRNQTWRINVGAGMLFLFILFKYFDWFYTFLDKSVFFLVAGVLMFVLGFFMEKGRRKLLANIEHEEKTI